eukprot:1150936-Pelagomonas_calceolata.AAC.4
MEEGSATWDAAASNSQRSISHSVEHHPLHGAGGGWRKEAQRGMLQLVTVSGPSFLYAIKVLLHSGEV